MSDALCTNSMPETRLILQLTRTITHLCECHPEHRSDTEAIITERPQPRTLSSQESGRTEVQWLRQEKQRNKVEGTKTNECYWSHERQNSKFILIQWCVVYITMWLTQNLYPPISSGLSWCQLWHPAPPHPRTPYFHSACSPLWHSPPFSVHYSASPQFFSPSIISPGFRKSCGTKERETNFRIWSSPPPLQLLSHMHCNPDFL